MLEGRLRKADCVLECRRIRVSGVVQGVGFRPFVWRLAQDMALTGWVRNDAQGVEIEAQGQTETLDRFIARLGTQAPELARVDAIHAEPFATSTGAADFHILQSGGGRTTTSISHDVSVCDDCLSELFDPQDRRYRYPFLNCTRCGPRFTLTRHLPYDRASTSMAGFALCPACRREYESPADRRFHAEPTACPCCGPQLMLANGDGQVIESVDPVSHTLDLLRSGSIVAIKGLGGFHLACDARNPAAVARLRARKSREEKPFALMFANVGSIAPYGALSDQAELLAAAERPIVLLRKTPQADAAFPGVAPGIAWLGVMLPYTPLHFLLFHEAAGRPSGMAWLEQPQPLAWVMTSANPGGEPLAIGNDEAIERLAGIADAFLLHDREILVRCDDSVLRESRFIRRARGYTPRAIRLTGSGANVLALGGGLKNTLCVTRGNEAFVSQHIGDLDNAATCNVLEKTVEHLRRILDVEPEMVAHDLHPDFFSTRLALEIAARRGVPAFGVQHHHAHIAAVCAEHGVGGPLLGLALDGMGLGTDGVAWGGELLRVEGSAFERLGHLHELRLPGGDRAAREPWRMAASALHLLARDAEIVTRFPGRSAAATVASMLQRNLNCPQTSSAGRWFDAAAGLLGVCQVQSFEGQAAMLLEGLAERHGATAPLANGYELDGTLDFRPLLATLANGCDAAYGAALFHATLAAGLADWVELAAAKTGIRTLACGGGCFLNSLLSRRLTLMLAERGITVLMARQLPPNDGGLALGQAWVARQSLSQKLF